MKILSIIFCLTTLCNTAPRVDIEPNIKRLSYDVPIETMNIPDEALIGDFSKSTLKELGMPSKSALEDYTVFNDSTSFDFMGFHYERADKGAGTFDNPKRTQITYEEYPECVYLGPVHREDESKTNISGTDYSKYVGVKTAFVYSSDYTSNIHTFPDLENLIYLSPKFYPNIRFPDKLKNIYFNPFLDNLSYYWSSGDFDTSRFDHKINFVVSEYDKLAAIKLFNSLDNKTVDPATWIKPELFYIDESEKYCENSSNNKYYEYGGFYYCNSISADSISGRKNHALFPGKYVTKGILHPEKVGINSQIMEIKFVEREKLYFEELYINTSTNYPIENFKGNTLYVMHTSSSFSGQVLKGFNNLYLKKSSSISYHFSEMDDLIANGFKIYVPTHNCGSYDPYEDAEAFGTDVCLYYDTSTVNLTLEVQNGGLTYTTIGTDFSYLEAVQYVIIDEPEDNNQNINNDNNNNLNDNKDTINKAAQAAITIFGSISGFALLYYIYKYIKVFIRWLKR